jgi:hypothetical protein
MTVAVHVPAGAGYGLFTKRRFARNELITEYDGVIMDYKQAKALRRAHRHSHIRTVNSQHRYIDGLKRPRRGWGGASFANDARSKLTNNAEFVIK